MDKFVFLLIGLLGLLFVVNCMPPAQFLKEAVKAPHIRKQLNFVEQYWKKSQKFQTNNKVGDASFLCAFCGIAINEIQGFIAENLTETEIEKIITQDLCDNLSNFLKTGCLFLVSQVPNLIGMIENRWSVSDVCIDLGMCNTPYDQPNDPQDLPHYTINLDEPPLTRWKEVCSNQTFIANAQFLYQTVSALLPYGGKELNEIGEAINAVITPEYAQEIQGCAAQLGVPYGWVTIFNLGYEVSDACTSIVAQTPDGKILHGRNLDFWAGIGLTGELKNMSFIANFVKGGKTVFHAAMMAGYSGVLSGIKPGAFSVTIDTRFYPEGISQLFYEVVAAILERNATLVSFLTRDVLMAENDFESALDNLSNDELIADVYYIMAGTKPKEGVVISRNRENATDIWRLDPSQGRWYEVETNYDHWQPPPWFDDRLTPANEAMDKIGPNAISLDGLWNVLSTKPVFNLQTTYTYLACPADGTFSVRARYCHFPCVQ